MEGFIDCQGSKHVGTVGRLRFDDHYFFVSGLEIMQMSFMNLAGAWCRLLWQLEEGYRNGFSMAAASHAEPRVCRVFRE